MGRAGQKPAVTFQEQIVKRKNRKDGHIQKIYGKKLEIVDGFNIGNPSVLD